MNNRGGQRAIRTWRVGEVGVEGTRLVLPGGMISVEGVLYQVDTLLPCVGDVVYFHDDDPTGPLELRHPVEGVELRSIRVGFAHWHYNGRVSMMIEPYLGRAFEVGADLKARRRLKRAQEKRRARRERLRARTA